MSFDRLGIIRFIFRGHDGAAAERARRWSRAKQDNPALATDLIELSGLLALPAERLENDVIAPDPIDPIRMAREQGEQAMAKKLLALMGVSITELNHLMTEKHYED
jgi:hypothetical protein